MSIDVTKMVRLHLTANGFEGLVSEDSECGCTLDDLAPCGEMKADCAAGHRIQQPPGGEFDYLIFPGHRKDCQACKANTHNDPED